ncbi:glycosyltransferase family 2 protein, partial [Streptomyces kebangsaanensis]|uniref:glycosyltransferase family 2 protein n=1 Tax=Streptomyces kebangsaanensis TaxID=864058 RepID=UPI001160F607
MSPRVDAAPSITVVVPAYNAAATLGRALDSLVVQTCQDFEAVVVDDASQDSSRAVAESYADRIPRLRVISRQTNSGGVGAPRNDGIRAARGEYVMFLDSDDELPVKACELLLESARNTGADITAGRAHRINLQRDTTQVWQSMLYGADRTVDGIRSWPELINDPIAAAKLYRRDFLLENEIFFPEGVFYEDTFFSAKSYTLASGISVVAEPVYRWVWEDPRDGSASITNRRAEIRSISDRVAVHRLADEFLRGAGAEDIKVYKDARFISHDVRLYAKELRAGDERFRTAFLDIVSEYLTEIDERAYPLCGPLDRVRAFYLRHRLVDEALTVADFEQRRGVVSTDLVRRGDRVYWSARHTDLPGADEFLDVTELGLQNESFENCKLSNRVTSLAVDGTTVTLGGEILNQFQRIGTNDAVRLVLHVRAKDTGERTVVEVPDVRVDESRISYRVSFDLGSAATVLSSRSLVNLNMQVLWEGRKHTTALCVHGRDLAPLGRALEPSGLWPDITGSGNLVWRPAEPADARGAAREAPGAEHWQWWQGRELPANAAEPAEPAATVVVFCAGYGDDALRAALNSLACQEEFGRTQVLLVTSGADPDVPAAVEFADRYDNTSLVRVPAGADAQTFRQAVLDRLTGPYVAFTDGSGVLAEGALTGLYAAAADDVDIVVADTWQASEALREADVFLRECFEAGDRTVDGLAEAPGLLFAASPGGKLFRRDLLRECGFHVGDGWDLEHITFVATALLRARRIRVTAALVHGVTDEARSGLPARDRRETARGLLALYQSLLDAHATADPERRAALRRFVAGSFHPYLVSLPKMMVGEELEALYPKLRTLYRDIPEDLVLECAGPNSSLLTHHAVKAGNAALFTRPFEEPRFLPELSVAGPVLFRRTEGDVDDSTLLRVQSRSAQAESVRPVDGDLRVEGFLTLDDVDISEDFGNRLELVFTAPGGREHAVRAQQVYRRDRWHIRKQTDLYSGWRADLGRDELAALHGGAYSLAVRLHGPGGFVDIPVTARPAFHRFKGVDRIGAFRYEVSTDTENVAHVRVARRRSAAGVSDRIRRLGRETGRIVT